MKKGLIHIYCGDGKGKTTASVGLAVRAAGAGKKVVFTQLFKDGSSSEIANLQKLDGIRTVFCPVHHGLYFRMNEEQKERARADYAALLELALEEARDADLLILDEVISTFNYEVISQVRLLAFLQNKPSALEVVMTGRNPDQRLLELADYVTEMKKIKHPFEEGVPARKGIEF